jgi:hypothetical protein
LRCHEFNNLVNNLPQNITHLIFDYNFNKPLDNLPHSIEFIKIKDEKLVNKIPLNAKIITF